MVDRASKWYLVTVYRRGNTFGLDVRRFESTASTASDKAIDGLQVLLRAKVPGYTRDDAIGSVLLSAFKAGSFAEVELLRGPDRDGMYLPKFTYTP